MSDKLQWYHINLCTYGSWLHGDPRGFRTRHHREHVEGDYKNPPPPGKYTEKKRRSRQSLKQAPVVIPKALRPVVGNAVCEKLEVLGAFVLILSVSGQHIHILAKMPLRAAREWAGIAKKHVWHVLHWDHQWKEKLWAKRSKDIPVKDRRHQINVYKYIKAHRNEGAWVWDWMEMQGKRK